MLFVYIYIVSFCLWSCYRLALVAYWWNVNRLAARAFAAYVPKHEPMRWQVSEVECIERGLSEILKSPVHTGLEFALRMATIYLEGYATTSSKSRNKYISKGLNNK